MYFTLDSLPIHQFHHARKMVADNTKSISSMIFCIVFDIMRNNTKNLYATRFLSLIECTIKLLWLSRDHVHGRCHCDSDHQRWLAFHSQIFEWFYSRDSHSQLVVVKVFSTGCSRVCHVFWGAPACREQVPGASGKPSPTEKVYRRLQYQVGCRCCIAMTV